MTIPNIFHFVYGLSEDFGGKPFSCVHYLAMESSRQLNNPEKIFFVCEFEPNTNWFDRIAPHLEIVRVKAPDSVFGNPLRHFAHKADVIRLERLRDYGGIYLDLDTISVKSLESLRHSTDFVIGSQLSAGYKGVRASLKLRAARLNLLPWQTLPTRGLCNAVLMAKANSAFVNEWFDQYRSFNGSADTNWDYHSVVLPEKLISTDNFNAKVVSPFHFHYPLWDTEGLADMFERNRRFPQAFLHHLWESKSWDKYLSRITPEWISESSSTYAQIASQFIK